MIHEKMTYGYKDLGIVAAEISYIKSRSECNPSYGYLSKNSDTTLPIFASPMTAVVSNKNYETFEKNSIQAIIPIDSENPISKRIELMNQCVWVAFTLTEFENLFCFEDSDELAEGKCYRVCVDVANGHMAQLYDMCKLAKRISIKRGYVLIIMTGNINNPKTYNWIRRLNNGFLEKHKINMNVVDYIRVGIGGGEGCITSSRTGIHYGQATLIDECNKIKREYEGYCCPMIVADGGIRDFSDVIKALALGADYVMIGSVFARFLESAGKKTIGSLDFILPSHDIGDYVDFDYDDTVGEWIGVYKDGTKHTMDIDVEFFGMASGNGQRARNGKKTKVSEGVTKTLSVNFTIDKWVRIMTGCLKSAMSYCNSYTLHDFIGKQELVLLSQNEINSLNK